MKERIASNITCRKVTLPILKFTTGGEALRVEEVDVLDLRPNSATPLSKSESNTTVSPTAMLGIEEGRRSCWISKHRDGEHNNQEIEIDLGGQS